MTGAIAPVLVALLAPVGVSAGETGRLVLNTDSGAHAFTVEVARTPREKGIGLMFRRSLAPDAGMLFIYERPDFVSMWMQNTYIPLDMIFIAANGKVHRIERHAQPFSTDQISSQGRVKAVLELNAGTADAIGLKAGDEVVFPGLGDAR